LNKIALIFGGSIAATIIITVLALSFVIPQPDVPPTGIPTGIPILEPSFSTPLGTFYQPRDVAQNNVTKQIYVADTRNSRIQVFEADGTFNSTFAFPDNNINDASLNQPFGIAINSTGFVFVADTFTNVIKIYFSNGTYAETIGIPGTASGEYYRPSGIAINNTHIFVADTFNHRIQILDLTGATVDTIP
jgi:DNA-binding beta-propeller fold protein YncE